MSYLLSAFLKFPITFIFMYLCDKLKKMPEIFRFFGIRFFYFSNDHLPIHVHIKNADGAAKFNIDPVELIENKGVKKKGLLLAESIIEENKKLIITHWNDSYNS